MARPEEEELGFGQDFMRCPGQPPESYRTYGANYPTVFRVPVWTAHTLYVRLDSVPATVYMTGDSTNKNWGMGDVNSAGALYHPIGWVLDYNYPNDGGALNDTNAEQHLAGRAPYNAWGPVHWGGTAGNFQFSDGHAETVTVEAWADNNILLWGAEPSPGAGRPVRGWTYAMYE